MTGNFACTWPSDPAMIALYAFLTNITYFDPSTMSDRRILEGDYLLYGECQFVTNANRDSPGAGVAYRIKYWRQCVSLFLSGCVSLI